MIDHATRDELIKLRRNLHKQPELSGSEHETAVRIKQFLSSYEPDELLDYIGGYGIAACFYSHKPGPSVLFRCELDALPIQEVNKLAYASKTDGVAHLCGHDGHMAILAGLAAHISQNRPTRGKVILLFQPAEETGQGAYQVTQDKRFESHLKTDYAFALHNIPGIPLGKVVWKPETFASASRGFIARLHGKTSHAGEPENGKSPALAMANIIQAIEALPQNSSFKKFTLTTVIHAILGERAFGTTPGEGVVMATLRSWLDEDMKTLTANAENHVKENSKKFDLAYNIEYVEDFPAAVSNPEALTLLTKTLKKLDIEQEELKEPYRWSEDFAHFGKHAKAVLFGLGSGKLQPQLHNPDYDFPDQLIEKGVEIFAALYQELQNAKS
ncbi:MAG: amidohydrolase [Bacteroidales bacterium]